MVHQDYPVYQVHKAILDHEVLLDLKVSKLVD
jgi:hypothetical protein